MIPFISLVFFAFGGIGAIADFIFTQVVSHRPVETVIIYQSWVTHFDLGLAILVKACWILGVFAGFTQALVRKMAQRKIHLPSAKKNDATPGTAPGTAPRWGAVPLRSWLTTLFIALIMWSFLLLAAFTEESLLVEPVQMEKTSQQAVPMVDFHNAEQFAALKACYGCGDLDRVFGVQFRYPNTQTLVQVAATLSGGEIRPMEPLHLNSSYALNFHGPALRCHPANLSTTVDLDRLDNITAPDYKTKYYSARMPVFNYYAVVPAAEKDSQSVVAMDPDRLPESQTEIENGTIPISPEIWIKHGKFREENRHVCSLQNASFKAQFSFLNGKQSVTTSVEYLNDLQYLVSIPRPDVYTDPTNPYFPQSDAVSYQAIWLAIAQHLLGRFNKNPLLTQLSQTPIMGSSELSEFYRGALGGGTQPFPHLRGKSIPEIVEEMSQNITLSFFASQHHLTKTEVNTEVTVCTWVEFYWTSWLLWLASYGPALFSTLIFAYVFSQGDDDDSDDKVADAAGWSSVPTDDNDETYKKSDVEFIAPEKSV